MLRTGASVHPEPAFERRSAATPGRTRVHYRPRTGRGGRHHGGRCGHPNEVGHREGAPSPCGRSMISYAVDAASALEPGTPGGRRRPPARTGRGASGRGRSARAGRPSRRSSSAPGTRSVRGAIAAELTRRNGGDKRRRAHARPARRCWNWYRRHRSARQAVTVLTAVVADPTGYGRSSGTPTAP